MLFRSLAPVLMASIRPGGFLVLSGILQEQAKEVIEAYQSHFDHLSTTTDNGWVRVQGQKIA